MGAIVEVKGFGYAWPGALDWTLTGANLRIDAGECCCLTGATGSGKSTLALALKAMLPTGRQMGSIAFPSSAAPRVGLVLQNPETQLFASTLGEEVAFALENRGVPPERMPIAVSAALHAVGLDKSLEASVSDFSMGQKYRVLLASVLVMQPELLILDEPAAQLDSSGLNELRKVLVNLTRQGTALLLCEHRPQAFNGLIDKCWRLDEDGKLHSEDALALPCYGGEQCEPLSIPSPSATEVVVQAAGLVAGSDASQPLWRNASFVFTAGQRILVQGPNGAGKTTLLRLLAGLESPLSGEIKVFGRKPSLQALRGRLGFLFQNPQRQLFEDRVIDEVAFSLKRCGVAVDDRQSRAKEVLGQCGIADLAERSPHRLSFGQKHLVALASVLIGDPELLLLDDPFAGLDDRCRRAVWSALLACNEKSATTIVWTSHHDAEVPPATDVLLTVTGDQIVSRTVR